MSSSILANVRLRIAGQTLEELLKPKVTEAIA
jgi:hypothetical protein